MCQLRFNEALKKALAICLGLILAITIVYVVGNVFESLAAQDAENFARQIRKEHIHKQPDVEHDHWVDTFLFF